MVPAGFGGSVEGFHATAAAVAAGRVLELWVERGRSARAEVAAVIDEARSFGSAVHLVEVVTGEGSSPQGLRASCRMRKPVTLEEAVSIAEPAAVLVLDHVEDPHNLGAIARSAIAAGVRAMVVSSRRTAPFSGVAFKVAAGALERIQVAIVSSVAEAVAQLRRLGLWVVALDASGDQTLFGLTLLTEPVVLIVGGEGGGVSRLVIERSDVVARIPLVAGVDSLNVSVAAAIGCFEIARVRSGAI
jgi:23S rRNA (guanosine2251-2'-O)-methyltransferase